MELRELERKSGYYHGYMILEDCVENGEILYDRALKKSLKFQAKGSQLPKNLKAL